MTIQIYPVSWYDAKLIIGITFMKQFIPLNSVPDKWAMYAYFSDSIIRVRHTRTHTFFNSET